MLEILKKKALSFFKQTNEPAAMMGRAVNKMLTREKIWTHNKHMISKDEADPARVCKGDLANIARKLDDETLSKFARKREQKQQQKTKAKMLVTQTLQMNRFGKAKELFEMLYKPSEMYVPGDQSESATKLKACSQKSLNDYVNPIC